MATTDELLDALMMDCKKPDDLIGENGLLKQLFNKTRERVISAEVIKHRGSQGERR
jgi:hypothetical protein